MSGLAFVLLVILPGHLPARPPTTSRPCPRDIDQMMSVAREDLALVALASLDDESPSGGPHPMSALLETFDLASDRLGQQMALATTLRDLRERGLVEDATTDGESLAFGLTETGRTRATTVRNRLADATIEVEGDGDGRRPLTLAAAAAEFDRPIPRLVAGLSDDDVYYHDEGVERRVVGRDGERDRCRGAFEAVRDTGRGRALFVTGPGGIGKTSLVTDVLETARAAGLTPLESRCREADGAPYHPLNDLLAQLDTRPAVAAGDGLPVDDPEQFQHRQTSLFYELTRALTPADDEPPRVLFLDDLHLADSGTIAYLAYLGTRLPDLRVVLLASYRPTEFSPGIAFDEAFDDADDHVTYLRLRPLDRAATRDVIEQTTGHRGAPDTLVEAIYERTGGNPLFVEETVTALVDANQLDPRFAWYPDDADAVDVPAAVREAIDGRIAALPAAARTVLEWAAVIGERAPIPVLERVVDLPRIHVETLIEVLVEADIFDRTSDRDVVTFRSEVVRSALRDGGTAGDERAHHATVAGALETEFGSSDDAERDWAANIATHHERAENTARAIEWYRRAGEHAMDVYAHDTAVSHLSRALELAREIDDDASVLAVNERLVRIALVTAAFDRAERHIAFARERETDPTRRQRLAALATQLAILRGEYDAAVDHANDGIAIDTAPSRAHCTLLLGRAGAEDNRGAFDDAISTAETAYRMANDLDEPDLVLEAQYRLGEIASKRDRPEDARTSLREALAVAERLDDRPRAAKIHLGIASVAYKQDDWQSMREHNVAAVELFEDVGDPHGAALALANLANVDRKQGAYADAREQLQRAIETFEALGDHHSAARNRGNLASIALSQGDLDTAREYYEEALAVFEEVGERREVAIARSGLGEVALKRRRYDRARTVLLQARDAFEDMGIRRGVANMTLDLAIIDAERGDADAARASLTGALETLESLGARGLATNARLALAYLDAVTGSPERGLERWDDIAAGIEALDPSFSVDPFERLIRGCLEVGDPSTAIEWCDRVLSHLDSLDGDRLSRLHDFLVDRRADLESGRDGE